jgi:hypothetical protein
MVIIMTPASVLLVIDKICYCCCIQHRLESLDMHVDLFVIFMEMGGDLIDQHPRSKGIVSQHATNLFTLVLDLTDFLTD